MSLIIVETAADQPLTDEILGDAHRRVLPCLEARDAIWQYSLLSTDRQRMICTFKAPDAESVRESYRRAGLPACPVWTGDLIEQNRVPQQTLTTVQVMEGTYPSLNETDWQEISRKILHYCAAWNIEWLRSYLSLDRTKVVYELNSPDIKLMQAAQQELGISCDRIWSAQILNPGG